MTGGVVEQSMPAGKSGKKQSHLPFTARECRFARTQKAVQRQRGKWETRKNNGLTRPGPRSTFRCSDVRKWPVCVHVWMRRCIYVCIYIVVVIICISSFFFGRCVSLPMFWYSLI